MATAEADNVRFSRTSRVIRRGKDGGVESFADSAGNIEGELRGIVANSSFTRGVPCGLDDERLLSKGKKIGSADVSDYLSTLHEKYARYLPQRDLPTRRNGNISHTPPQQQSLSNFRRQVVSTQVPLDTPLGRMLNSSPEQLFRVGIDTAWHEEDEWPLRAPAIPEVLGAPRGTLEPITAAQGYAILSSARPLLSASFGNKAAPLFHKRTLFGADADAAGARSLKACRFLGESEARHFSPLDLEQ